VNPEPAISLGSYALQVASAPLARLEGRVKKVVGQLVEVEGVHVAVGRELDVITPSGTVPLEVIGFRDERLLAAPLGPTAGISPGARVRPRLGETTAEVGDEVLGRVIDAFGRPLDGRPLVRSSGRAPLHAQPPAPFERRPIDRPLSTGVRALDAILPLAEGQRIGLFAGTGVGKSTLLGMMCRHADADVIVAALIGERGREVGDFVRNAIGPENMGRCVVVAATSDTPPLVRVRGALRATAIAEHFRKQGKRVLLVMDSVTRFAMALREASLAAGEPPLTKGYTPTVFAALPPLLERAGRDGGTGSITAVYTVLVEGDDLNDPSPTRCAASSTGTSCSRGSSPIAASTPRSTSSAASRGSRARSASVPISTPRRGCASCSPPTRTQRTSSRSAPTWRARTRASTRRARACL